MIRNVLRLEFEHVFPKEEEKDILEYLKLVSPFSLLNIIGFSNTKKPPNFDTFFSNVDVQRDIIQRVVDYSEENHIYEQPTVISRQGSLRLAEIILSNRTELIEQNDNDDRDTDEMNLFKAFLIVNKKVNAREKFSSSEDNFEKLVDMVISMMFPVSDLGMFENDDLEFAKLLYCTLVKFEMLINFLQSDEEYNYLEEGLCRYFNQDSSEQLTEQVTYLLAKLMTTKYENVFKFYVDDDDALTFLNTLSSSEVSEVDDFTHLKNYPLYKLADREFAIIDYFFIIDKFYKSVRFVLKGLFHEHDNLPARDRAFFNFFNTDFSEEVLMHDTLENIFHKKYFVKKKNVETADTEPDYYVRHGKRIYLFEFKDILVRGDIKSSGNIDEINGVLRSKFFEVNNKPIGTGQLVTSITQIVEDTFEYDDYVCGRKNLTIYPILIIGDRIFEIPGVNHRLNQ